MPDGRMVSRSIALCEQLAEVSLEADYFFARCIPHLDCEGRVSGNPKTLKATVCPLRGEIDSARIAAMISELTRVGLVLWFQVGDDVTGKRVLQFTGFKRHQRGARFEREAPSRLPGPDDPRAQMLGISTGGIGSYSGPTPDQLRSRSGPTPEAVPLSEVKVEVGSKVGSEVSSEGRDTAAAPLSPSKAGAKRSMGTLSPEWQPNDAHRVLALTHGLNVEDQAERMRDWAESKGEKRQSWDATFRTFLRRAADDRNNRGAGRNGSAGGAHPASFGLDVTSIELE